MKNVVEVSEQRKLNTLVVVKWVPNPHSIFPNVARDFEKKKSSPTAIDAVFNHNWIENDPPPELMLALFAACRYEVEATRLAAFPTIPVVVVGAPVPVRVVPLPVLSNQDVVSNSQKPVQLVCSPSPPPPAAL